MKAITLMALLAVLIASGGCSGGRERGTAAAVMTQRRDVFRDARTSQAAAGGALLNFDFPIKANRARFIHIYFKHTDPPYTAILSIDGQSTELSCEPVLEDLPGDFRKQPEAGVGWKYSFSSSLALMPGKHRITVTVPQSGVSVEKEVELKEGLNILKILPIYRSSLSRYRNSPRFTNGLAGVSVQLNGQPL